MIECDSVESKALAAQRVIEGLLRDGMVPCLSWSAGKDSSVCAALTLRAAAEVKAQTGSCPPILLHHGDTLVEQPEISLHARAEIAKMSQYAQRHGLDLRVAIVTPALSSTWQVKVIGGRGIPTFVTSSQRNCTIDLKRVPIERARKAMLRDLKSAGASSFSILGTRYEESQERRRRMEERGETSDSLWLGDDGQPYLSPIAHWSSDDVFELLGLAAAGRLACYSDFSDTLRIYADSGGSSCAVVADMATASLKQARPCGARTGCWSCTPIGHADKSMDNLIATSPRYSYLAGLSRLRNWLVNTQYDWSARNWLGRTLDADGYVTVLPDVYSPSVLEKLLRWCLSLDVIERREAARAGVAPRFQVISLDQLIAIDASWSLQGYFKRPFSALAVYRDVVEEGNLLQVPLTSPMPKVAMPPRRYLKVGEGWSQLNRDYRLAGLEGDIFGFPSECGPAYRTEDLYSVSEEGAEFVFGVMFDELMERHDRADGSCTDAFRLYLQYGTIAVTAQSASRYSEILRRTVWKERHGLVGEIAPEELLRRCEPIGFSPESAGAGVQLDLLAA